MDGGKAWILYMKYPVRNAGFGLACLYMTVLSIVVSLEETLKILCPSLRRGNIRRYLRFGPILKNSDLVHVIKDGNK